MVAELLLVLEVDFTHFLHFNYVLGHPDQRLVDETLKLRFICCRFYLDFLHVQPFDVQRLGVVLRTRVRRNVRARRCFDLQSVLTAHHKVHLLNMLLIFPPTLFCWLGHLLNKLINLNNYSLLSK